MSIGLSREQLAKAGNGGKLQGALNAYLRCFTKYKNQVKHSGVAWRRAAEVLRQQGERERALRLLDSMIAELGGALEPIPRTKRTDDMKWAQIQLNLALQAREKW